MHATPPTKPLPRFNVINCKAFPPLKPALLQPSKILKWIVPVHITVRPLPLLLPLLLLLLLLLAQPLNLARRREQTADAALGPQEAKLIQLVARRQVPIILPLLLPRGPAVEPFGPESARMAFVVVRPRRRGTALSLGVRRLGRRRLLLGRRRHHVRRVAADLLRRELEQLEHVGAGAAGVGARLADVVEPVDGGFGLGEDLARVRGHVLGTEGELEEEDGEGAFEVVQQHPPHCALAQHAGVGFVENEVDSGPGGLDALVGRADVLPFGGARVVLDAFLDPAQARTVDDCPRAVEEDAKSHSARLSFRV